MLIEQGQLFDTPHRAGGKALRLPVGIVSRAVYGGVNDCYRYRLERVWNAALPTIMWLMMNPSTATEFVDDATLAKVRKVSALMGFGRMLVGNSFAYRATDQSRLAEVDDPEGPHNIEHLFRMGEEADLVVLGFGRPKIKALQSQGPRVAKLLLGRGIKLHALQVSADGTPWHPLYIKDGVQPTPWFGMAPAVSQATHRQVM